MIEACNMCDTLKLKHAWRKLIRICPCIGMTEFSLVLTADRLIARDLVSLCLKRGPEKENPPCFCGVGCNEWRVHGFMIHGLMGAPLVGMQALPIDGGF